MVVTRNVRAPLRSMTRLAPRVVPCTTCSTSLMPTRAASRSAWSPRITPSAGSRGVVSSLPTNTAPERTFWSTKSVKVPPMSKPRRHDATSFPWTGGVMVGAPRTRYRRRGALGMERLSPGDYSIGARRGRRGGDGGRTVVGLMRQLIYVEAGRVGGQEEPDRGVRELSGALLRLRAVA